jgi:hypothetical protein
MTNTAIYGHWITLWDFDSYEWLGFIYKITHVSSNRVYVGKKFFRMTTRKIVKNRKNRKRIVKESDWKSYTGSSKWLNSEIELFGKDQFKFEIISLHESKGTLAYSEIETLVKCNALRAKLSDGTKAYYNGLIPPCKFTPPDESEKEKKFKIMI